MRSRDVPCRRALGGPGGRRVLTARRMGVLVPSPTMSVNYLHRGVGSSRAVLSPHGAARALNLHPEEWIARAERCGLSPTVEGADGFIEAALAALREDPDGARRDLWQGLASAWESPEAARVLLRERPPLAFQGWCADEATSVTLACLLLDPSDAVCCDEVLVEIVTVHPDSGFPAADPSVSWSQSELREDERRFVVRTLLEREEHARPRDDARPMRDSFLARGIDPMYREATERFDAWSALLLWGVERVEHLPWTFDDDFWARHVDRWWAQPIRVGSRAWDLRRDFPEPSDHQPYASARYRLLLHPAYAFADPGAVVEGAAHWS